MKVLVTGGSGFIGRSLIAELVLRGIEVRATSRNVVAGMTECQNVKWIKVDSIGPRSEWKMALTGIDAVIHLAARAHVLREGVANPEAAFFETNYEGTRCLADACLGYVKRFVYLSSIGVHGSLSRHNVFNEDSALAPEAAYARSKAEAELYLRDLTSRGDLDCRILRPPLVYGANAPGNLARLVSAVRRGVPLPFAAVNNRRSLINVQYLVQAILAILLADNVARSAYVVADRDTVSTADIVRVIAQGVGRSPRLWPVSPKILKVLGALAGRQSMLEQVVGNLEVDATKFRHDLGDLQSISTLQGLSNAARAYTF